MATYSGAVTGADTGSVLLTGTVDEQVIGRTSNAETGTFATDVTDLLLTGILSIGSPYDGNTLKVTLGGPSSGMTTITPMGSEFRIDSFFDVFIDVTLEGTGLSKSGIGPIPLVAVPEPSTWALMLVGFVGFGFAALQRARARLSST